MILAPLEQVSMKIVWDVFVFFGLEKENGTDREPRNFAQVGLVVLKPLPLVPLFPTTTNVILTRVFYIFRFALDGCPKL